ncbi:unnamed protein product [Sphacelaria rigidula]
MVWYNTSRSNTDNGDFERWQNLIHEESPHPSPKWNKKFVRPAQTRRMVVCEGRKLLVERWEQVAWLFCTYAPRHLKATPFRNYWAQSACMLRNPCSSHVCGAAWRAVVGLGVQLDSRRGGVLFEGQWRGLAAALARPSPCGDPGVVSPLLGKAGNTAARPRSILPSAAAHRANHPQAGRGRAVYDELQ